MLERYPVVYIMSNKCNGTLYTGVTSNIVQRVYQHKQSAVPGFTNQYGCKRLAYYKQYGDMYTAISREKQVKGESRKKKLALIASIRAKTGMIYMKPCFKKLDCFVAALLAMTGLAVPLAMTGFAAPLAMTGFAALLAMTDFAALLAMTGFSALLAMTGFSALLAMTEFCYAPGNDGGLIKIEEHELNLLINQLAATGQMAEVEIKKN